jgi:hypothetical protein
MRPDAVEDRESAQATAKTIGEERELRADEITTPGLGG